MQISQYIVFAKSNSIDLEGVQITTTKKNHPPHLERIILKNLSGHVDCGMPSVLYGTEKTDYVGPLFHSRWVH